MNDLNVQLGPARYDPAMFKPLPVDHHQPRGPLTELPSLPHDASETPEARLKRLFDEQRLATDGLLLAAFALGLLLGAGGAMLWR